MLRFSSYRLKCNAPDYQGCEDSNWGNVVMEYIKLINRFWETNRNTQLTMAETTLYFYLLNEANHY